MVPPHARLGCVGVLLDTIEMTRSHVRRQYGAIDVLPTADRFDVARARLLSIDGKAVRTEGGVAIATEGGLDSTVNDIVVIADFAADAQAEIGSGLARWLTIQRDNGAIIAACGAAVTLMAQSGVADHCALAAPPWLAPIYAARWPTVLFDGDREMVEQGNLLSGSGGRSDLAVAVRLIEAVTSRNVGRWLAAHVGLSTWQPDVLSRPDTLVARAQDWLADHFPQPIGIDDLARALDVSRRTLHRHFVARAETTPSAYLQHLRIEAAKRMLERTPFPVERIASLVGYSDASFFRETFKRKTAMTPRQWRARHDAAAQGHGGTQEEDGRG